jgi:peptidoglycan/LPS O-acetylase OafA/YrhL
MNPNPHPAGAAGVRLHGLDALRAVALLAGLALHGAMSYLPGADRLWIVSDTPSDALSLLFYVVHCCRMPIFFLLAGFFAAAQVGRLGAVPFARDRLRRIVLPLLLFWPVVMTGIIAAVVAAVALKNGGTLPAESPPGPRFTPDDFPLTHLWFLYVLALFYIAALAIRGCLLRIDRGDRFGAAARNLQQVELRPGIAAVHGAPHAQLLACHENWMPWFGVPTPDQSLYPNLAASVGFGLAFAVGWQLRRSSDLLPRLARDWLGHLLAGLVALGYCISRAGVQPQLTVVTHDPAWLVYAFAYAAAGWCLALAATGAALRHAARHSARMRYLSDASYWVYLTHLPVLMALQVVAAQMRAPWWLEYPLQLAAGLALLLALYHAGVRGRWLGALLGGHRRAPAPMAEAVP